MIFTILQISHLKGTKLVCLLPLLSLGTTGVIYGTHFRFRSWHFILFTGAIYWTLYPFLF